MSLTPVRRILCAEGAKGELESVNALMRSGKGRWVCVLDPDRLDHFDGIARSEVHPFPAGLQIRYIMGDKDNGGLVDEVGKHL